MIYAIDLLNIIDTFVAFTILDRLSMRNKKVSIGAIILLFIVIGIVLSILIDKLLPDKTYNKKDKLYHVGLFSMIAIIIHNIPEGIATFLTTTSNLFEFQFILLKKPQVLYFFYRIIRKNWIFI